MGDESSLLSAPERACPTLKQTYPFKSPEVESIKFISKKISRTTHFRVNKFSNPYSSDVLAQSERIRVPNKPLIKIEINR